MNRIALAAFALALAPAAALADPAVLRQQVMVQGDVIRLGDLFDPAGPKASATVAHAPQPGKRIVLDSLWLTRVATSYGVEWKPMSKYDRVTVERESEQIPLARIESEILRALAAEGVPANAQVEFTSRDQKFHAPAGSPAEIGVRDAWWDQRSGRFSADVDVSAAGQPGTRARMTGRVFTVTEVPVLARQINRGEVVTAQDVRMEPMRDAFMRQDVVLDLDQLIGKEARYSLRGGAPVRNQDLRRPIAVAKNALVTIVLRNAGMTLTSQGRAVEEGGLGDTIRVANTQSKKIIEATVEGASLVSVQPFGNLLSN